MTFNELVGNAILGIDTLWGGDVMCASGTGRFIADSWFSDEPLPAAYTHPTAARVRASGGVAAKEPDRAAIDAYLAAVDVARRDSRPRRRRRIGAGTARRVHPRPRGLLRGDVGPGDGGARPGRAGALRACVLASTGRAPSPSDPAPKRERVAELLARAGHPSHTIGELLAAVERLEARSV